MSAGDDVIAAAEPYLGYLSDLAGRLGLIDPVATYFRPLAGEWGELTAEADRLRQAAAAAADVSARLSEHLGRLDAGWEGRDADSFVAYIQEIGAAGGDVQEALTVLAGALDELVTTLRHVLVDLAELLVDAADLTSESMTLPSGGTRRARAQLQETQESAKALRESARDVLEAFARLCDGVDDPDAATRTVEVRHRYPQERFRLRDSEPGEATVPEAATGNTVPEQPEQSGKSTVDEVLTPAAADDHEGKHTDSGAPPQPVVVEPVAPQAPAPDHGAASSGMPMMPMMGMGGGLGGGGRPRAKKQSSVRTSELFGEPGPATTPPVIGEDEKKPK